MEEIWKPAPGFEGFYEVSNKGNVKSVKTGKLLKRSKTKRGYIRVWLTKRLDDDRILRKSVRVHRLVALAFIPKVEGKDFIDHIDGNPGNNNVENLRWVTHKENVNNPITLERQRNALKSDAVRAKIAAAHNTEQAKLDTSNKVKAFYASERGAQVKQSVSERCSIPVQCVETGQIFGSFKEAAEAFGMSEQSMSSAVRRCEKAKSSRKSYKGKKTLHFKRYPKELL